MQGISSVLKDSILSSPAWKRAENTDKYGVFSFSVFIRQTDVVNEVVNTSERDSRVNLLNFILSRLVAEVIILFCGSNIGMPHLLHNEFLINIGVQKGSAVSLSDLMHRARNQ